MNKEDILKEIEAVDRLWFEEKAKNGGREGSTLSFMYKSQYRILVSLLKKYFDE